MAIQRQSTNVHGTGTSSPTTVSHTLVSGSDRIILVAVGIETQQSTLTGVGCTYGGVSMTQAAYGSNGSTWTNHSYLFYLLEADLPSNGANTVSFSCSNYSGATDVSVYAMQYSGVSQGTPKDTDGQGNTSQALALTLSIAATDLAAVTHDMGNAQGTWSTDSGFTEQVDYVDASSTFTVADLIATGSDTSVTTTTTGSVNRHSGAGVVFEEAASGTNVTVSAQPAALTLQLAGSGTYLSISRIEAQPPSVTLAAPTHEVDAVIGSTPVSVNAQPASLTAAAPSSDISTVVSVSVGSRPAQLLAGAPAQEVATTSVATVTTTSAHVVLGAPAGSVATTTTATVVAQPGQLVLGAGEQAVATTLTASVASPAAPVILGASAHQVATVASASISAQPAGLVLGTSAANLSFGLSVDVFAQPGQLVIGTPASEVTTTSTVAIDGSAGQVVIGASASTVGTTAGATVASQPAQISLVGGYSHQQSYGGNQFVFPGTSGNYIFTQLLDQNIADADSAHLFQGDGEYQRTGAGTDYVNPFRRADATAFGGYYGTYEIAAGFSTGEKRLNIFHPNHIPCSPGDVITVSFDYRIDIASTDVTDILGGIEIFDDQGGYLGGAGGSVYNPGSWSYGDGTTWQRRTISTTAIGDAAEFSVLAWRWGDPSAGDTFDIRNLRATINQGPTHPEGFLPSTRINGDFEAFALVRMVDPSKASYQQVASTLRSAVGGWEIYTNTSGQPSWGFIDDSGTFKAIVVIGYTPPDDEWSEWHVRWDNTTKEQWMSVDGQVASFMHGSITMDHINDTDDRFAVAVRANGSSDPMEGGVAYVYFTDGIGGPIVASAVANDIQHPTNTGDGYAWLDEQGNQWHVEGSVEHLLGALPSPQPAQAVLSSPSASTATTSSVGVVSVPSQMVLGATAATITAGAGGPTNVSIDGPPAQLALQFAGSGEYADVWQYRPAPAQLTLGSPSPELDIFNPNATIEPTPGQVVLSAPAKSGRDFTIWEPGHQHLVLDVVVPEVLADAVAVHPTPAQLVVTSSPATVTIVNQINADVTAQPGQMMLAARADSIFAYDPNVEVFTGPGQIILTAKVEDIITTGFGDTLIRPVPAHLILTMPEFVVTGEYNIDYGPPGGDVTGEREYVVGATSPTYGRVSGGGTASAVVPGRPARVEPE